MLEQRGGLFRREALEGRRIRLEGEVLLPPPRSAFLFGLPLVVALAVLLGWLSVRQYSKSQSIEGVLASEESVARIAVLRPGIVTKVFVREGQRVRAGQVLAKLQALQGVDSQDSMDGGLEALRRQQVLAIQQRGAVKERFGGELLGIEASLRSARDQQVDLDQQLLLQEELVKSLAEIVARYAPAAERGYVSRVEMARRSQELILAKKEAARIRQQRAGAAAEIARLHAELRRTTAASLAEQLSARSASETLAVQEIQFREQRSYELVAPIDGVVDAVQIGIGQPAEIGATLMVIAPVGLTLHAELFAPSRAVGFLRPGQQVRLRYDAFPHERFGSFEGKITSVSHSIMDPGHRNLPQPSEPVFRVKVAVLQQSISWNGEKLALHRGMKVSATVTTDRRNLVETILQPLYAMAARGK